MGILFFFFGQGSNLNKLEFSRKRASESECQRDPLCKYYVQLLEYKWALLSLTVLAVAWGNLFLSRCCFPVSVLARGLWGLLNQHRLCLMWLQSNAVIFTFHIHFKGGICFTTGTAAMTDSVTLPSVQAHASETLITNRCCSESRIPLSGYSAWAMSCLTWILRASWETP